MVKREEKGRLLRLTLSLTLCRLCISDGFTSTTSNKTHTVYSGQVRHFFLPDLDPAQCLFYFYFRMGIEPTHFTEDPQNGKWRSSPSQPLGLDH